MKSRGMKAFVIFLLVISLLCVVGTLIAPYPLFYSFEGSGAPEYVLSVWPPPESKMWLGWYNLLPFFQSQYPPPQSITVVIDCSGIIADLETPAAVDSVALPFLERVLLYVDGALVSNSKRTYFEGGGILRTVEGIGVLLDLSIRYNLFWHQKLARGLHNVRLVIDTRAGEVLEYEWEFWLK